MEASMPASTWALNSSRLYEIPPPGGGTNTSARERCECVFKGNGRRWGDRRRFRQPLVASLRLIRHSARGQPAPPTAAGAADGAAGSLRGPRAAARSAPRAARAQRRNRGPRVRGPAAGAGLRARTGAAQGERWADDEGEGAYLGRDRQRLIHVAGRAAGGHLRGARR
jgi:hypothetical protein